MSTTFNNPPINEVVVATYFNPPLSELRSEHVGLFWNQIRDDFPVVQQQPPLGMGPDLSVRELFPMPRYWFIGADEVHLLQLQKDALMLNWRHRDGNEYPQFPYIKGRFDHYYHVLSEFARTEIGVDEPTVGQCELTYVNVVGVSDYWTRPEETRSVIPSFALPSPGVDFVGHPSFNCQYFYRVEADLRLDVSVRSGPGTVNDGPRLIFEIKAIGHLGNGSKSAVDAWFDNAHDSIINCFVAMTDQRVQVDYWQRSERAL
jgi:uncharacterized protein (TIGR04255 family)